MQLEIERAAARRLLDLPPKMQASMMRRLEAIAEAPFALHANVAPMAGMKDCYRLRLGDWRAIYRIERSSATLRVLKIAPRGEAYR
ncbi:MAG: type II toxin-antitoxin system RelE/ParE family toxin [Alphaproteobacteria bacterium]|nr:type II toxin-antitoxin system RelE/ParE family toxin [Alphaproteobacteria bacterium]